MLNIPDIIANAADVIDAAEQILLCGDDPNYEPLKSALSNIRTQDLADVMNEVGRVYMAMNNIKIMALHMGPVSAQNKTITLVTTIGLNGAPVELPITLSVDSAEKIRKSLQESIALIKPSLIIL